MVETFYSELLRGLPLSNSHIQLIDFWTNVYQLQHISADSRLNPTKN